MIGEAENGAQAIEMALHFNPDVILMDLRMPVMDSVTATQQLCDRMPGVKILVLTTLDEDEFIAKAMQSGAIGYLLKDTPAAELAQVIRSVSPRVHADESRTVPTGDRLSRKATCATDSSGLRLSNTTGTGGLEFDCNEGKK